jgi:hypothetical protein
MEIIITENMSSCKVNNLFLFYSLLPLNRGRRGRMVV